MPSEIILHSNLFRCYEPYPSLMLLMSTVTISSQTKVCLVQEKYSSNFLLIMIYSQSSIPALNSQLSLPLLPCSPSLLSFLLPSLLPQASARNSFPSSVPHSASPNVSLQISCLSSFFFAANPSSPSRHCSFTPSTCIKLLSCISILLSHSQLISPFHCHKYPSHLIFLPFQTLTLLCNTYKAMLNTLIPFNFPGITSKLIASANTYEYLPLPITPFTSSTFSFLLFGPPSHLWTSLLFDMHSQDQKYCSLRLILLQRSPVI